MCLISGRVREIYLLCGLDLRRMLHTAHKYNISIITVVISILNIIYTYKPNLVDDTLVISFPLN